MIANAHLRVTISVAMPDKEVSRLYPRRHKDLRKHR